ncbi:hypothetical protein [Rhizobium laguerreae]|uniref:hypothetical protein n=1 Tax=Rhizobium laguerreae TaxID=1076926 RepID=UPI001C902F97|nr:hypothetical protein [Rhizobium laguerreae]MBY3231870.1 hypothetical protein [Rhizobium laguerreae]
MPRIKLMKPSFANLTGQLPGKNFRGVNFTSGISDDIPLAVVDKIAAQIAGCRLVDGSGVDLGPAGSAYRKTTTIPTPVVPRTQSVIAEGSDSTRVRTISTTTYTLAPTDVGMILDFTVGTVVTVPASLPAAFNCALRQGGANQIQVVAGVGATVEEIDGKFKSEKRLALLTLARFPDGKFQLIGRTAA